MHLTTWPTFGTHITRSTTYARQDVRAALASGFGAHVAGVFVVYTGSTPHNLSQVLDHALPVYLLCAPEYTPGRSTSVVHQSVVPLWCSFQKNTRVCFNLGSLGVQQNYTSLVAGVPLVYTRHQHQDCTMSKAELHHCRWG